MFTIEKKSVKVGKYVTTEHVDTVIRNYKQERWIHNTERLGKEDSLSGWYSIEEMQEFLERAKQHGGDGVRIYFGAYPKKYEERPEFAGRQTLVFVATKHKETEMGPANKDIYIQEEGKTNILAYNAMFICPPICNPREISLKMNADVGVTIVDKGEKGMSVI